MFVKIKGKIINIDNFDSIEKEDRETCYSDCFGIVFNWVPEPECDQLFFFSTEEKRDETFKKLIKAMELEKNFVDLD